MFVIVPNYLSNAIYAKIDEQLTALGEDHPAEVPGREQWFRDLLRHYNEHGEIPEFHIGPSGQPAELMGGE